MITITFEEKVNISKLNFKNPFEFVQYLQKKMYFPKLHKLEQSQITCAMKEKIEETKKMNKSKFINILYQYEFNSSNNQFFNKIKFAKQA